MEADILKLETDKAQASSVDHEEQQQLLVNITIIFTQRFDREELRTFCFHLGIDYDDLPADGKANIARELTKYLHRHDRIEESIALGKSLRPDIEWDKLSAA